MSRENKRLIEEAAAARGESLNGYAVSHLVETSAQIVEQYHHRSLSDRDRDLFLELLDNDEPNAALQSAAAQYKAESGG